MVGTLELTGVPFTGCRHWPIAVCHRKYDGQHPARGGRSAGAGVHPGARRTRSPPTFPLPAIVKPNAEDASVGIDRDAVCTTRRALRKRVATMLEHFDEVLVQQYVAGREFNVGFVGDRMLPISEIRFDQMPEGSWPIVTYAAKWHAGQRRRPRHAAGVPGAGAGRRAAPDRGRGPASRGRPWRTGEGYGRVDLRVDEQGQPWVLEVNPCPDLSSDAGLARMGRAVGLELRRAGAAGGRGDAQPRPAGLGGGRGQLPSSIPA